MTSFPNFGHGIKCEVIDANVLAPKLNIAIVSETWPPEVNGVALSVLQLSKGLQSRGHRILLVRPDQQHRTTDFSPEAECLVRAQAIPKYPELRFGWPQLFKIGRAFDKFKPDIVHIVTEGPLGLAALNIAKQRNLPVSSGFHSSFHEFSRFFDLAFLLKPVQHYLRWFHNRTDLTCVPSNDTQAALEKFGVTCPLVVVSRGVDTDRFNPARRSEALRAAWGADENTTVMVYAGRVSPEKNIDLTIRAYRQAKQKQPDRHFKLVVIGDGPDRARLEALEPEGIFVGMKRGTELAECYASADVFVFGSEVETFGNVVLEALASGLPVVAYDYACAATVMTHGQHGWVCPIGQADQLTALAEQLPDQATLRRLGMQAHERASQFGWNLAVDQFDSALQQAVAKHESLYSQALVRTTMPFFLG